MESLWIATVLEWGVVQHRFLVRSGKKEEVLTIIEEFLGSSYDPLTTKIYAAKFEWTDNELGVYQMF